MARQTSLFGKINGKLGAVVFSTNSGEIISREYNPNVSNPNTPAQINQRARMKLMSQFSACLASEIVMKKEGLISPRNKFVKRNFDACYANNGLAQITYENVQLTEGSLGLTGIKGWIDTQCLCVGLSQAPDAKISRVVYIAYKKTEEGRLSLIQSVISQTRAESDISTTFFTATFDETYLGTDTSWDYDIVIYAYGLIETSERARARYADLNIKNGTDIATLVANRQLTYEDFQFTQTRGTTLERGHTTVEGSAAAGQVRVFVTASGSGTVSGGGSYEVGTSVTVTATPSSGATFVKWVRNGSQTAISTSAKYTFVANEQMDLVAIFNGGGNDSL